MWEMREELQRRCNTIEEAYEFMLAYAAQGVSGDAASNALTGFNDDLNGDGNVDILDLVLVGSHFGERGVVAR